jgi:hypothetical protein
MFNNYSLGFKVGIWSDAMGIGDARRDTLFGGGSQGSVISPYWDWPPTWSAT